MRRTAAALLAALAGCAHTPTGKEREAAVIHNDLAVEAMRNGRPQEAMREFDEALRLNDGLAEAHLGRGVLLELSFSRTAEAEAEYRRALELKPGFPEAHNNLGQILARNGQLEGAIREFDAALADMLYREPWVARCNKGQALWRLGRKADGAAEMRACLEVQPRYCAGWRELGRLQLGDGQVQDAVASLEQYAAACDRAADAHYQLALALLKAGQAERARDAFGRCADLAGATELGSECRRGRERLQ